MERPEQDPDLSRAGKRKRTKKRRRRFDRGFDKLPISLVVVFGIIVAFGLLGAVFSGKAPAQSTEYTSVPQDVIHVETKSQVSLGYRVVTAEWIVVADGRSAHPSESANTLLLPADKVAVQNLAALSRIAHTDGEPITFSGLPLLGDDGKRRMVDGKPVLLARKILYRGEEILLRPD